MAFYLGEENVCLFQIHARRSFNLQLHFLLYNNERKKEKERIFLSLESWTMQRSHLSPAFAYPCS